jgi:hypothetical protein
MKLDREIAQAYRDRWQLVAEVENAQQQQTSLTQRWQTLNALLRMAAALGIQPSNDQDAKMAVYARWNQLREAYLSRQQQ